MVVRTLALVDATAEPSFAEEEQNSIVGDESIAVVHALADDVGEVDPHCSLLGVSCHSFVSTVGSFVTHHKSKRGGGYSCPVYYTWYSHIWQEMIGVERRDLC